MQFTPDHCRAILGVVGLVPGMTQESVLADIETVIETEMRADKDLKAQARLYPSISLGASFSQMATHPEDLFKGSANSFALLGGVTVPIFHGGTLTAAKRGAEAEAKASAARYRQTVLEAFGQVSDLLAALDNDSRSLALQNDAAAIAERSLGLSRRSFAVGNSGVLQVIEASRSVERTRIALVDARARQFVNVARLYVATAGGWAETAE